ncbi:hypothetical protein [Nocardiopsis changdeensis]|uniref:hypothetical protein n=1 Tax=Nocardiopsis changdeensis TaxID=2831969 RepID=UPI003F4518A9
MQEIRLLDERWNGARLQLVKDTLLASVEAESGPGLFTDDWLAVPFDLAGLRPLGPVNSFGSPVHLVGLPSLGPAPVLASTTSGTLKITDVRDGDVLKVFPLPRTGTEERFHVVCDLALGHHRGRDLLFLHEESDRGPYHRWVSVVDLTVGEPIPDMAFDHYRYREISERLTLQHGYLACPTTEEVVEFQADDFSVIDKPFIHVRRADDGSWVGKVSLHTGVPEGRAAEIAHTAGHTYLAEAGDIVTLPDLEPVFAKRVPWVAVSRVTEWDGRPVAVLVQERASSEELPGRLCHLFLDTDHPKKVDLPWSVPPEVYDLLATPDGTIVVSSAGGVHVLNVDPAEASRANPR